MYFIHQHLLIHLHVIYCGYWGFWWGYECSTDGFLIHHMVTENKSSLNAPQVLLVIITLIGVYLLSNNKPIQFSGPLHAIWKGYSCKWYRISYLSRVEHSGKVRKGDGHSWQTTTDTETFICNVLRVVWYSVAGTIVHCVEREHSCYMLRSGSKSLPFLTFLPHRLYVYL